MASTRLPGKVLLDLNGRSVLSYVIDRCRAVKNADVVCCAIPNNSESDPVAWEAKNCGSVVYRGSEQDVLDRYFQAAKWLDAKVILRVTSDCPMIDPEVCEAVLDRRAAEDADFATNNMPPSWPHGLDCEAMKFEWLERAWLESTMPQDREHVTMFIRRHKKAHKLNVESPGGSYLQHRWTLDYPEDLEYMRALFAKIPSEHTLPTMKQMLGILDAHPEISAINNMHHAVSLDPDSIPAHDAKRYEQMT